MSPTINKPIDWDAARQQPFADVDTPNDWPRDVKPMNWQGMNLLGADGKGGLYWDGKKLRSEVKLGWFANLVGALIAISTVFAAAATISMSVLDLLRYLDGR
jgi:hypothetical protein